VRRVKDIMATDVWSVTVDTSLAEAAALLDERQVTGVPVMSRRGEVVGMLSRTDLVARYGSDPSAPSAGDAMTAEVLSVRPDDLIDEAARLMAFAEVHRLLVLDDAREVVGIVTSMDVLRELAGYPRRSERVLAVAPPADETR
jgi:predicted transcriptional regulator